MKSITLLSASAVALVTLFLSGCDKKTTDDLKRQAGEAKKKIKVKAKEAQPKVEEMAGKAKEATKEAIEKTKEAADAASEKIKDAMSPTPTPRGRASKK